MSRPKVKTNRTAFNKAMKAMALRTAMENIAEDVADGAARRGTFKEWEDIDVDMGRDHKGRPVAHVGIDDSFVHLDEFGSINTTPSAPLRRTIMAMGGKIKSG